LKVIKLITFALFILFLANNSRRRQRFFIIGTVEGSEHTWCWRDEDDGDADFFCYLRSLLRVAVYSSIFFVHSPLSLSLFLFLFPSALLYSPLSVFFSCCFFSFLCSSSLCFLFLTFSYPSVFFSFLSHSSLPLASVSFFSLGAIRPLAFIARGCMCFPLLLQGWSNGRRASWWREISTVKHAPLIEANQRLRCCKRFSTSCT